MEQDILKNVNIDSNITYLCFFSTFLFKKSIFLQISMYFIQFTKTNMLCFFNLYSKIKSERKKLSLCEIIKH